MPDTKLASRYAEAIFAAAHGRHLVDQVEAEITEVAQTLAASPDLMRVLDHPEIRDDRKCELVRRIFRTYLSAELMSFLELLVTRGRQQLLPEVAKEYQSLADRARGILRAEVVAASPLTEQQAARLEAVLSQRTGLQVHCEQQVDPELLAGALVRIGSQVLDGSAKGRLEELRRSLVEVRG